MFKRRKPNSSRRGRPRRPPLTEKTMSGLREIVAYIETREPADILGDDPRSWRGTPQAAELAKRWEAVESACKWIESLGDYKLKKTLSRPNRGSEDGNEFLTDLPPQAARRRR